MRSLRFRGHCPSELRVCPALLKPCSRSRIRENSAGRSPPNSHEFGYEGRGMPKGFNRASQNLRDRLMRWCIVALAAFVLLPLVTAGDDAAKKEIERFRGTWKFESIELEGQAAPPENFKDVRLIIDGEKFTMNGLGTHGGTFKVDVSKKPKSIDVTFTEGPDKGKT